MVRTQGARRREKPTPSTEAGAHRPVPSTGTGHTTGTTSMADTVTTATSKGRSTVRGQYGLHDTTPSASTALALHSSLTMGSDTEPRNPTESRRPRSIQGSIKRETQPRRTAGRHNHTVKGQYGHYDTTPSASPDHIRPSSQADPGTSDEARRPRTAPCRGPSSNAEEEFASDAATARRARLRHETLLLDSAEDPVRYPLSPPRSPRAPTDKGTNAVVGTRDTTTAGTSAAERVRRVMNPASRNTRQMRNAGNCPGAMGNGTKEGDVRTQRTAAAVTTTSTRGEERNAKRLRDADAADRETLGESPSIVRPPRTDQHLPGDASLFSRSQPPGHATSLNRRTGSYRRSR
jgi:hypothetical protein